MESKERTEDSLEPLSPTLSAEHSTISVSDTDGTGGALSDIAGRNSWATGGSDHDSNMSSFGLDTVVVVTENERFVPVRGWGSTYPGHHLPTDTTRRWCAEAGFGVARKERRW